MRVYERVGRVVRDALEYAISIIEPGMPVLELCERVESRIRSMGARPAFPLNVSINEVAAHYTAVVNDGMRIPKGAVVKVDVGAHIDGYIVDAAVTVIFNQAYGHLVKAAAKALEAAQAALRPGNTLGGVGAQIERVVKSFSLRPIENLSGHLIRRYELHAGKSVPNVASGDRQRVLEGEVYAVEPFVTNGRGLVEDRQPVTIFRVLRAGKQRGVDEVLRVIEEVAGPLPFTPRWLVDRLGPDAQRIVEDLYRRGELYGYPMLVEQGGGLVAQVEDTFVVTRDGAIPTVNVLELVR